jgi:EF-P beta-lysylation protein EpmB
VTATARAPWQEDLRDLVADGPTLARALGWPELAWAHLPGSGFPLRTTRHYLSLVDPRDPRDPILLQILPALAEDAPPPDGFRLDAVGDLDGPSHPAPGLIQKYPGRALVVTTSHCAVHCRYCFRRHYPYDELREAGPAAAAARTAIAADPSIHEVILSGGDPWSLPDGPFRSLVHSIAQIPHVRRLRVHTRMPVVLPRRVTPELVETLTGTRLRSWVVVHFNHPRELHPDAVDACTRLVEGGVPVLNQSVLLRGVNDDENVLAELCEGLVDIGVKPYYLHQLDRVQATAHWEVPEAEAARIVEQLRVRVSGIAMPQWVRDEPGRRSKTPLW